MKAIKVFAALTLAAAMLAMPVLAAEFVPSIEYKDGIQLNSYTLEEINTPCRTVHIIPFYRIYEDDFIDEDLLGLDYDISEDMEESVRISQRNAQEELKNNLLQDIVAGFEEVWARITGGAPLENAVVTDLFEIVLICSEDQVFKTDEKVTVSFTVEGIGPDDLFVIIHKPTGSDKWVAEENYTIDENGVITMTVDKLSPFAIVKDSGKAPVVTVTSPQTGVTEFTAAAAVLSMAALVAGGVVVGWKFRKMNVH